MVDHIRAHLGIVATRSAIAYIVMGHSTMDLTRLPEYRGQKHIGLGVYIGGVEPEAT
jgi:hypothetical protein